MTYDRCIKNNFIDAFELPRSIRLRCSTLDFCAKRDIRVYYSKENFAVHRLDSGAPVDGQTGARPLEAERLFVF